MATVFSTHSPVGSDEEAALTKAIKQCFPSSHHLLCTRHLQENVRKYLSDKVEANSRTQKKILKDIFSESCESMNHIIKLSTNWKSMKIPDLIERLYKIVRLQQVDTRRALYGQGNYELAPWVARFQVRHVDWVRKTEKEKEELYRKFKKGNKKTNKIVSTDGKLTVPGTPKTAKKTRPAKKSKEGKDNNNQTTLIVLLNMR